MNIKAMTADYNSILAESSRQPISISFVQVKAAKISFTFIEIRQFRICDHTMRMVKGS